MPIQTLDCIFDIVWMKKVTHLTPMLATNVQAKFQFCFIATITFPLIPENYLNDDTDLLLPSGKPIRQAFVKVYSL